MKLWMNSYTLYARTTEKILVLVGLVVLLIMNGKRRKWVKRVSALSMEMVKVPVVTMNIK